MVCQTSTNFNLVALISYALTKHLYEFSLKEVLCLQVVARRLASTPNSRPATQKSSYKLHMLLHSLESLGYRHQLTLHFVQQTASQQTLPYLLEYLQQPDHSNFTLLNRTIVPLPSSCTILLSLKLHVHRNGRNRNSQGALLWNWEANSIPSNTYARKVGAASFSKSKSRKGNEKSKHTVTLLHYHSKGTNTLANGVHRTPIFGCGPHLISEYSTAVR